MKLDFKNLRLLLPFLAASTLFFGVGINQRAQNGRQLPEPVGHINDFAGIIEERTKLQLERMLESVKQQSGIDFAIATVDTTGGVDIFDYSRQLAREWNLGSRATTRKSLLLVISVQEQDLFTQFSRSVQPSLPEGIIGEMARRLRPHVGANDFNESLMSSLNHFLTALSRKVGFNLEEMETPSQVVAAAEPAVEALPSPSPTVEPETEVPTVTIAAETPPEARRSRRISRRTDPSPPPKVTTPEQDEDESEEVELTLTLPLSERIDALKEFLRTKPDSNSKARAIELLVSAHATLGDQKLKAGDNAAGVEHLMLALHEGAGDISDQLFSGVISQIPMNLYLRGEHEAALKAAAAIEAKHGDNPTRLLALTAFFLGLERGDEAVRLAEQAVKLAPDMAEAHRVLALSLHISLRLDEAAAEYKEALALDPASKGARRNLADLKRAIGKTEEALALYQEQLGFDPSDKGARTGVVLSLFDLGRNEEGNAELEKALQEDPRNLALLTGAAYWFVARNDSKRGLELATKAAEIEPRYTWTQIALSRALIGEERLIDAERAIRFAKQYGRFATLEYELATVLAASGLYEEAAEVLLQSFTIRDGEIETRLAGHIPAQASSFVELLAPERRAGIFQSQPADNDENARQLKALLSFAFAMDQSGAVGKVDEAAALAAAREFASGRDSMRTFRQIFAASRLLTKGVAIDAAYELSVQAKDGVEAALDSSAATVAVQADEYRGLRAQAMASGITPYVQEAPKDILDNILRGRIENLSGWALFNLDRTEEALEHLRRAAEILPEGTPQWRTTLWRLGVVLEQTGEKEEALTNYIKSYNVGEPDPVRRTVIERLYETLNGSLEGLENRMVAGAAVAQVAEKPVETGGESPTSPEEDSERSEKPETPPTEPAATPEASPSPESLPSPTKSKSEQPEKVRQNSYPGSDPSLPIAAAKLGGTVKVAGKVVDSQGVGIPNVTVVLISPRGTVIAATTDAEGNYSFKVQASQRSYRLIPSLEGYTFQPMDKVLPGLYDDQKDLNFVGERLP